MTKYAKIFKEMMAKHHDDFASFAKIHDLYKSDRKKYQTEFNLEGEYIVEIIREYEKRLCSQMEKGSNSVFSAKLADKFLDTVRTVFPLIDFVGTNIS